MQQRPVLTSTAQRMRMRMRLQALISKPFPMLPVGIEPTTFGLKMPFAG
jgi:hypothetical protein